LADWALVTTPPQRAGNELSLVVAPGVASRFFRLRSGEFLLTLVTESSPFAGESAMSMPRKPTSPEAIGRSRG
jgi:hypothetical protein